MDRRKTPSQSVMKAYLRQSVDETELEHFRLALEVMLQHINENEQEEYNKNLVSKMLEDSLYRSGYMLNPKGRTDLAIYNQEHKVKVLFEVKGPGRAGMVKKGSFQAKAMYELVLYYLKEEFQNKNTGITHLIVTDCYDWYVFEKKVFYHYFGKKTFREEVFDGESSNNVDYVYEQIIRPQVAKVEDRLEYTYFSLKAFENKINDRSIYQNRSFRAVYKFLSPIHLLQLQFQGDHYELNQGFYDELLYIMGLHEMKEKNTDIRKIVRFDTHHRQSYSLVEQVLWMLDDYDVEEDLFEVSIGLVLMWVNRLLFLKLLESQLVKFNRNTNLKFLSVDRINSYSALNQLFFKVLARPIEERNVLVRDFFKDVPYLNSSLFEMSNLEKKYFSISNISDGKIMVYPQTKVKDNRGNRYMGEMNTLEYLFRFLDAYDYGDNYINDATGIEQRTIINPSVLGLIFEKINGYKDGAYFTPGYITEYIARENIRRAVIDKFNEAKGWSCEDFEDLKLCVLQNYKEVLEEANAIINQVKICDPAVGSGHFLVSALNELIAIKSELHLFFDPSGGQSSLLRYNITVEHDELVVTDAFGDVFQYERGDAEKQRVQEALFEEKRQIIENCLFGVDLNPNSVEICCLRLWIELLKNAYYYKDANNNIVLQTLPNIDANLKCGDSIFSRIPVQNGREIPGAYNKKLQDIKRYKDLTVQYKNCNNKKEKRLLLKDIESIKQNFKNVDKFDLFGISSSLRKISSLREHSMEWMFEFPEIIDDNGIFRGFDIVLGNPPYIGLQKIHDASKLYGEMKQLNEDNIQLKTYQTYLSTGDISSLFVERGLMLLKPGGYLSYILPNKWMKVGYGKLLRKLLLKVNLHFLADFGDIQIFDNATTYTCIIGVKKEEVKGKINIASLSKLNSATMQTDIEEAMETFETSWFDDDIWVVSSAESNRTIECLRRTMKTLGVYLGEGNANRGVLTGLTEAFTITDDKAHELGTEDASAWDVLRPFLEGKSLQPFRKAKTDKFLIFLPKGITRRGMGFVNENDAKPSEEKAWTWFSNAYPSVANWLKGFEHQARGRSDKGDYWWELRACSYYDKFEKPKLFYQALSVRPCFSIDTGQMFCNNSIWFISNVSKSLLALLNSNIFWWLISEFCPRIQNGYQLIGDNFFKIPIPDSLPVELGEIAEKMETAIEDVDNVAKQQLMLRLDEVVLNLYGMTAKPKNVEMFYLE